MLFPMRKWRFDSLKCRQIIIDQLRGISNWKCWRLERTNDRLVLQVFVKDGPRIHAQISNQFNLFELKSFANRIVQMIEPNAQLVSPS